MKLGLISGLALLMTGSVFAQQSEDFGAYTVHYNVISTSELDPGVAQAYNIKRSSNRALLNITVLHTPADGVAGPARAVVTASGRNLTGQQRSIEVREISEADEAIYYLGEFRVNNMETFDFTVSVIPEGENTPLEVKFRQQFYTE